MPVGGIADCLSSCSGSSSEGPGKRLPNGFSVDLEDNSALVWRRITGEWGPPGASLDRQMDTLLETLAEFRAKATFFTVADVARHRGALIRRLVAEGHEIACHGLFHESVHGCSERRFRSEIRLARQILEDVSGAAVDGYRAPYFSLRSDMGWAYIALEEEGYRYDASIRSPGRGLPRRIGRGFWEAGLSEVRWMRRSWPLGGAWLAALPASADALAAAGGAVLYMHPYNLGGNRLDRPLPPAAALWQRCRHQQIHNLLGARFAARLRTLLAHGKWRPLGHLVSLAEAR